MDSDNHLGAFQFTCPFSCIIAGPSGSGKTSFVVNLIKNARELLSPPVERIEYCYSVYQPLYGEIKHLVSFTEGLPDIAKYDGNVPTLLLMDDLMDKIGHSVELLFTKLSHHYNISVIHITQNLFQGKKENRTISLNSNYFVLFKNV